jgi:anthranilate synthase component 1
MEIVDRSGKKKTISDVSNPLLVLREICRGFKPVEADLVSPFHGGLVGYCNYDMIRKWERLPEGPPEGRICQRPFLPFPANLLFLTT